MPRTRPSNPLTTSRPPCPRGADRGGGAARRVRRPRGRMSMSPSAVVGDRLGFELACSRWLSGRSPMSPSTRGGVVVLTRGRHVGGGGGNRTRVLRLLAGPSPSAAGKGLSGAPLLPATTASRTRQSVLAARPERPTSKLPSMTPVHQPVERRLGGRRYLLSSVRELVLGVCCVFRLFYVAPETTARFSQLDDRSRNLSPPPVGNATPWVGVRDSIGSVGPVCPVGTVGAPMQEEGNRRRPAPGRHRGGQPWTPHRWALRSARADSRSASRERIAWRLS